MVSRTNGTRVICGYRSNLTFSALLVIWPGRLLAAAMRAGLLEKWKDNSDIKARGVAVLIKDKIHACMFQPGHSAHE